MHDKELIELVEKAKGERSISKFSRDSDVSRPYLSQILNNKIDNPPRPQILKKIAKNSGRVEYKDLMAAAGHLEGIYYTDESKQKIESAVQDDAELYEFWQDLKKRDDLKMMFKQTRNLPPQAIKDVISIIKRIEVEEGGYKE